MRIFLAGATGVIGRRATRLLVNNGHHVTGTTRHSASLLTQLGARPCLVDVYDRDALTQAIDKARPDVVMHQLTDLSDCDRTANSRVREEGTRNLVDAARNAGVRRI